MIFPNDLLYSTDHTWLRISNNIGTIGITDFAQNELGEMVYVDLPNVGEAFEKNQVFGSAEALKTVSDLFMPIHGKVIETNKKLLQTPTLINNDPYGEGWMLKVEITTLAKFENLFTAEQYELNINQ